MDLCNSAYKTVERYKTTWRQLDTGCAFCILFTFHHPAVFFLSPLSWVSHLKLLLFSLLTALLSWKKRRSRITEWKGKKEQITVLRIFGFWNQSISTNHNGWPREPIISPELYSHIQWCNASHFMKSSLVAPLKVYLYLFRLLKIKQPMLGWCPLNSLFVLAEGN